MFTISYKIVPYDHRNSHLSANSAITAITVSGSTGASRCVIYVTPLLSIHIYGYTYATALQFAWAYSLTCGRARPARPEKPENDATLTHLLLFLFLRTRQRPPAILLCAIRFRPVVCRWDLLLKSSCMRINARVFDVWLVTTLYYCTVLYAPLVVRMLLWIYAHFIHKNRNRLRAVYRIRTCYIHRRYPRVGAILNPVLRANATRCCCTSHRFQTNDEFSPFTTIIVIGGHVSSYFRSVDWTWPSFIAETTS